MTLNCIAVGNPASTITWKRLSDNSTVRFPLNISGLKDEGVYRCTADNGIGNVATTSDVIITVSSKCFLKGKGFVGFKLREISGSLRRKQ